MNRDAKRILLVDLQDPRRETRVRILQNAGYEVTVRNNLIASEILDHEPAFDLVLLSLQSENLRKGLGYGERLREKSPTLPVLLLTDDGVYAPRGTNESIGGGLPKEMISKIAELLAGSKHVREMDTAGHPTMESSESAATSKKKDRSPSQ